jgi:hypothetical protein
LAALPGFAGPGGFPAVDGGLAVLEPGLGLDAGALPVPGPGGLTGFAPPGLTVLVPGAFGLELGLGVMPCDAPRGGVCWPAAPGGLPAPEVAPEADVVAPAAVEPLVPLASAEPPAAAEPPATPGPLAAVEPVAAGPVGGDADVAGDVGGRTVAAGCGIGDLNVPVDAVDFVGTGACGGKTSTDSVKVRFSAACRAPTLTTWRVTSSPRSLRMAMITKYSSGCSSGGWRMMPSTRNAGAAATWRFAASESKRRWCMQPGQILRLSRIVALQ